MTLIGMKRCLKYWEDTGNDWRNAHKLSKKFSFFKAKAMLSMMAYDSYLLFADSKKRAYKRSMVQIMRKTDKAFEKQIRKLRSEACHSEAERNNKGTERKYKMGDQVSFFMHPSK